MRWPPLRRMSSGARLGATILAAICGALPVARSTVADLPPERSSGHAIRKEFAGTPPHALMREDDDDATTAAVPRPVETWATLINVHTKEAVALSSAEPTFARFSDVLADRVTGSTIELDPRLLELLRQIALRNPGVRLELVSGYRSPKLNEILRKKGHRVASHSQHSLGHAVDFRVIGLSPSKMKQEILKVGWQGGIGQYDKSSDLFVHADVGPKREWFERR
ncbi:MAG TPA: DUF882 domain-containing protein [Polyangiaceae bacterium]|nr:DUF882 domain-containing protein [Polyangiaceae bacterium]